MVRTERFWLCLLIGISLSTSLAASRWYPGDRHDLGLGSAAVGVLFSLPPADVPEAAVASPAVATPESRRAPTWVEATLEAAPTPLAVGAEVATALVKLEAAFGDDEAKKKPAAPSPAKAVERKHYILNPGVSLTPRIEAKVAAIAERFHQRTGKKVVVTSGTRSAFSQARAMHHKLLLGDNVSGLYRNKNAVRQILAAYRASKKSGDGPIERMAHVIREQTERGIYISRHLRAGAVDFRSRGLSGSEKRALREAVRQVGGVSNFLEESRPPHFHLEFN